ALVTAGAALLVVAWSRARHASHLLLPVLYVGGLSISVLVIANSAAHLHEVQHLLSGADVFVTEQEAHRAAIVLPLVGIVCAVLWRRWLLMAQNPTAARVAGLRPSRWDALFLALLAAVVVFGTSTSGILMVLAVLFLPPATVLPWTRRIPATLVASVVAGLLFLAGGFVLSVEMEWPLSQSVGGCGFAIVVVSHILSPRRAG
ncbi:MAG: metal ABC transporter permease, partial [Tepidisphaeraceae bacterium]